MEGTEAEAALGEVEPEFCCGLMLETKGQLARLSFTRTQGGQEVKIENFQCGS